MNKSREWNESEALLSKIRDDLGVDLEEDTEPGNFEWTSRRNWEFRMEFVRQSDVHERETCWRNWPYRDDEDSSLPRCIRWLLTQHLKEGKHCCSRDGVKNRILALTRFIHHEP